MGLAELKLGSVILPRSESPAAISRLAEFEWFHKIDSDKDTVTPEIDDVLLEAQKAYQSIDDVVKQLGIPPVVGMLEILFKGTTIKKKDYELDEISEIVGRLKEEIPSATADAVRLAEERDNIRRALDEYTTLKETIAVTKKMEIDMSGFSLLRYFYANVFVINASDYDEIARSFDGDKTTLCRYDLAAAGKEKKAAILVFGGASDSEKILKVFRNFGANPFVIPEGMPQVPSKAYALAETKIKEMLEKQKSNAKAIATLAKKSRRDILAMHEEAKVAKEMLETLRKPAGTRNFALIQGYIPAKMEEKFKKITGSKWTAIVEDLTDPKLIKQAPTLYDNKRFIRTFETITNSQGIPKKGEADPTPMIALMWPIFYGIMFADVGHGLLLMGMGLLFKAKGQGGLARWGMLIAISGAASAIAGVGAGEAFGHHISALEPFGSLLEEGGPLYPISWIVGIISVAELTFDQVIDILKVSLFIGIIHLLWAMILRIKKLAHEGKKIALYMEALPNITLYGGIIVIMMCAIGSQYDVTNMYSREHTEAVPWVTIFLGEWAQVWIVTRIAVVTVIVSMAMMMIGGLLHVKKHPEEGGSAANVIMEIFLGKTVESLAHTISYARIGIMLLVHAALLLTVNNSFYSLGGPESIAAWVMIVGGNIGIMMIEGLIVYIQSLRLHLYEFFTKWYDGGGYEFRQLRPEMLYNQFIWKRSK